MSAILPARGRKAGYAASLPPCPEGWFYVASRWDLHQARFNILQRTWMGLNVVVRCDGSGRVCVSAATCPDLGSDLGPESGGRIRDGRLVCPFHGYEFDEAGQCVGTLHYQEPRYSLWPIRKSAIALSGEVEHRARAAESWCDSQISQLSYDPFP